MSMSLRDSVLLVSLTLSLVCSTLGHPGSQPPCPPQCSRLFSLSRLFCGYPWFLYSPAELPSQNFLTSPTYHHMWKGPNSPVMNSLFSWTIILVITDAIVYKIQFSKIHILNLFVVLFIACFSSLKGKTKVSRNVFISFVHWCIPSP